MRKNKLVLISDQYKVQKTSSRSPINRKTNWPTPKHVDLSEVFQKVCCPNCRYLFKIVPSQKIVEQQFKKELRTQSVQTTQTMVQIKELIQNSSNVYTLNKNNKQIHYFQDNIYKKKKLSNSNISSLRTDKLQHFIEQNKTKTIQKKNNNSMIEKKIISNDTQNQKQLNNQNQQSEFIFLQQEEKKCALIFQLIIGQHNKKIKKQLCQLCIYLPRTIDLPSYCKMLMNE